MHRERGLKLCIVQRAYLRLDGIREEGFVLCEWVGWVVLVGSGGSEGLVVGGGVVLGVERVVCGDWGCERFSARGRRGR